jgi:hypothetical protein
MYIFVLLAHSSWQSIQMKALICCPAMGAILLTLHLMVCIVGLRCTLVFAAVLKHFAAWSRNHVSLVFADFNLFSHALSDIFFITQTMGSLTIYDYRNSSTKKLMS